MVEGRLRAASYNIHHGADDDGILDLERTAGVIRDSGADIVGLQEVDRHWGERSDFQDEARWLGERLHMHVVFAANVDEDPPRPGEPRRQYGTAILSRYPILDWQNTLLPKFEGSEQRGLLVATVLAQGRTVRFANTHLQFDDAAEREVQAKAVVELLAEQDLPTVLTGDLNATPGTGTIGVLTAMLRDSWAEIGSGPEAGFTFPADVPDRRIDYVLASGEWDLRRAEVLAVEASDHRPYVVDLALPDSYSSCGLTASRAGGVGARLPVSSGFPCKLPRLGG